MTDRRGWTIAVFGYVAVLGALLQMRGALLPSFGEAFGASEGQLGLIATVASVSFLVTVFGVGMTVSRFDVRRALLAAMAALAVVLFALGSSPTFLALLALFLLSGFGRGALHAMDRPLLSHLYPGRRGRVYNLQDMAWAAGATIGPLIAAAAVAFYGWRVAYYVVGLALVPIAIHVWRLEAPALDGEQALAVDELGGLLRTPAVASMGGLMLLLSLVESGVFTWLPYYVGQSLPDHVASISLSLYLAAYVPGRYAFSRAADRTDNLHLVLASAILATVALVAFLAVGGYAMLAVVFVVGFLVAGMFPTLLAWATNVTPEYSGPVNALALGISSVGFMIFPATMGVVAEYYDVAAAMALLAVAMGAFALLAGGIALRRR